MNLKEDRQMQNSIWIGSRGEFTVAKRKEGGAKCNGNEFTVVKSKERGGRARRRRQNVMEMS